MQITKQWLVEKEACEQGLDWFLNQSETDLYNLIEKLTKENHPNWANWLITRAMNRQQQLQYSIACAELVLPIFEKEYPSDTRPRLAIEAAKKVLTEDSKENRQAADAAEAYAAAEAAAYAAAEAAYAAEAAAYAAAEAAYAAEAYAAAEAAWVVAAAGIAAIRAACATKWTPIIEIGVKILKGNN